MGGRGEEGMNMDSLIQLLVGKGGGGHSFAMARLGFVYGSVFKVICRVQVGYSKALGLKIPSSKLKGVDLGVVGDRMR